MESTNRILDGFHAMRLVTTKRSQLSDGEKALLQYTAPERAQLCDRMCHVFQVLASSLMLEYPLTESIPSVAGIKDRLLGKIYHFRQSHTEGLDNVDSSGGEGGKSDGGGGESSTTTTTTTTPTTMSRRETVVVEEKDYALLYAYTLVTGQVATELKMIQREIENLFGVLSDDMLLLQ
jgi:hypothetical protein